MFIRWCHLASVLVRLADLLRPERVRIPLRATDKMGVLRELSELAANAATGVADDVLDAVLAREAALSTGIGFGVAVPHAQSDAVAELTMAGGTTPTPVPFEALDGQPVRLFFLLVGPVSAGGQHVKVLSRISRLVRRDAFRTMLLDARDAAEFCRFLADAEGR